MDSVLSKICYSFVHSSLEIELQMQQEHRDKQIASLHASHETEMENMKTQYKERTCIPENPYTRNEQLPDYQGRRFPQESTRNRVTAAQKN